MTSTTPSSRPDACMICSMEEAPESAVVFRDDLWAAEVVPGYDVPGWVVLRARRHAERITGLSDDELTSWGRRSRDLVAAVSEVMTAPATYMFVFGENYPHFHVLVAPRGDEVPADQRGGAILTRLEEHRDADAAASLVPALRASYGRASRSVEELPVREQASSASPGGRS